MVDRSGEVRHRHCIAGSSKSGTCVSFVTNSWKLWSEHRAAVELEHRDKRESYTAACWVTHGKQGAQDDEELLVLGCTSGAVQVWNPRSGEQVGPVGLAFQKVAQGVNSAVEALAAAPRRRSSVFAACRSWPDILEVGLYDGSTRSSFKADKVGVAFVACATMDAAWLLSVGSASTLKLWTYTGPSDTTPAMHGKFTGPANKPSCIDVVTVDTSVVAISCDGSSQVDVFVADATQASARKASTASYILSSHHQVLYASFASGFDASLVDGKLCVVGYGTAGVLLWHFELEEGLTVAKTLHPMLAAGFASLGGRVLYARWARPPTEVAEATASVVVGVGSMAKPFFAQVTLQGHGQRSKTVLTKLTKQAVETQRSSAAPTAGPAVRILGPAETTRLGRKRAAAESQQPAASKVPRTSLAEALPTPARVGGALSAAPLARQALRAGDRGSIEQIVSIADQGVIDATCTDLNATEALQMIREITKKLVSQPAEGIKFSNWIRSILVRHCTAMSQRDDFRDTVEPLREVLKKRVANWRAWARVRGCLRLYTVVGMQPQRAVKIEAEDRRKPLFEYVEGDEDIEQDVPMSDDGQPDDDDNEPLEDEGDDSDLESLLEEEDF
mmetsp:Transcript_8395/g.18646  ORF Transcript_8395/g.18646 Transcript_8395/m.18646 type:complete len:616 (+) Transcript_8395:116-1963(+)